MADLQEAINVLLVAKGVTPINDPESGHPDVQAGRSILERHRRKVNAKSWYYNTEKDLTLSPQSNGTVILPGGTIALDNTDYIPMHGKLYDPAERTNIFTEDVTGLTIIINRTWEELPTEAFDYIVAKAKEEFIRPLESKIRTAQAVEDIKEALGLLQIVDQSHKDTGKQTGNPLMVKWQQKMLIR